jgi:phosphate-selective porin OprO/OprP
MGSHRGGRRSFSAAAWKRVPITILLSVASVVAPVADAADTERIVITNARLIGRDAPEHDIRANLLIVGGKLAVVSKDDLDIQSGDIAVDAGAGFLLGGLVLDGRPTFLILDRDPREDFDVLMDTEAHVCFAIRDGVIVMNELPARPPPPPEATPKPGSWKAYTPPPIAVPIRYYDSRKWNRVNTKPISGLFVGALLLDRQFWLSQDAGSEAQVGDLSDFEGGEIRGLRFGLVGTLNFKRPWFYTVFVATNTFDKGFDVDTTDEFVLFDYRLDIPLPADLTLSVGKQKEPISMERLTNLAFLPMQERSAVADAMLPSRNHGLVLSGTAAGDWFTWAVGAFNNWIDSGESFSDTSSQLVGRVTWVPAVSEDESNLLHLGLGVRRSNAKQPIRGFTEPEFNNAPLFVDTGPLSADELMTYSLEAYWRKGPYLVGFEYLGSDVDSTESGDPFFHGYHIDFSWAVNGEMRSYRKRSGIFDPLPVSRPVNQGGWGTIETAFRYSRLDLTDGTVDGGEMDILSLGVNWWLTRFARFSVDYRYVTLDRFGTQGDSSGLNVRLMLMLD